MSKRGRNLAKQERREARENNPVKKYKKSPEYLKQGPKEKKHNHLTPDTNYGQKADSQVHSIVYDQQSGSTLLIFNKGRPDLPLPHYAHDRGSGHIYDKPFQYLGLTRGLTPQMIAADFGVSVDRVVDGDFRGKQGDPLVDTAARISLGQRAYDYRPLELLALQVNQEARKHLL